MAYRILSREPGLIKGEWSLPREQFQHIASPKSRLQAIAQAVHSDLQKVGLISWTQPEVKMIDDLPSRPLRLLASVPVLPPVKLPDCRLRLEVPPVQPVTEDLLLSEVVEKQYQHATAHPTETAAWGCRIQFTCFAVLHGEPIPGSLRLHHMGLVRQDLLLAGMAEQLIGFAVGDMVQCSLPWPETFANAFYQGQTVDWYVIIEAIWQLETPAIDELPAHFGYATQAEWMQHLGQELTQKHLEDWQKCVRQALGYTLAETAAIEIPQNLLVAEMKSEWERTEGQVYHALKMPEDFLTQARQTWLADPWVQRETYARLKTALALRAVAQEHHLALQDEEIKTVLEPIAHHLEQPLETVWASLQQTGMAESLLNQLQTEKTLDWLYERAVLLRDGQPIRSDFSSKIPLQP